jgi:hypothetical protein
MVGPGRALSKNPVKAAGGSEGSVRPSFGEYAKTMRRRCTRLTPLLCPAANTEEQAARHGRGGRARPRFGLWARISSGTGCCPPAGRLRESYSHNEVVVVNATAVYGSIGKTADLNSENANDVHEEWSALRGRNQGSITLQADFATTKMHTAKILASPSRALGQVSSQAAESSAHSPLVLAAGVDVESPVRTRRLFSR